MCENSDHYRPGLWSARGSIFSSFVEVQRPYFKCHDISGELNTPETHLNYCIFNNCFISAILVLVVEVEVNSIEAEKTLDIQIIAVEELKKGISRKSWKER